MEAEDTKPPEEILPMVAEEPPKVRSVINSWANFLFNEKLDPKHMTPHQIIDLVRLCGLLAEVRPPKINMHKDKLESRRFVCETAIENSIDLAGIKKQGKKLMMGRGLLDMWLVVYQEYFDDAYGTTAFTESKRRDIKTRLAHKASHI